MRSFLTAEIERLKKDNTQLQLVDSYLNKRTLLWFILLDNDQVWTDRAYRIYVSMDAIWYSLDEHSLRELKRSLLQRKQSWCISIW